MEFISEKRSDEAIDLDRYGELRALRNDNRLNNMGGFST